jgi:hypothetical protein
MIADEFSKQIAARNAAELARLLWENSILKKILTAGWPLTVDFADRKKHPPETAAVN